MDPDADPGLETPTRPDLETPVSTPGVSSGLRPASVSTTPGAAHAELASATNASASDAEATRREALNALAATATKRGIPLRAFDGSSTPGVAKPKHARPVAIGSPAQYKPLPSAFDSAPMNTRALALADAPANPFRRGALHRGHKHETDTALEAHDRAEALESELKRLRGSFERERDALRDVAEKVKRRAAEEVADAEARFVARARVLENEKEALVAERDDATKKSAELETAASLVERKCEDLFAGERVQCVLDVESARLEAAEEIARRETVWARERALLAEGAGRAASRTERDRELERQRTDRQFQLWDHERAELEARLRASETKREEERRRANSAHAFRDAVRRVVWAKKLETSKAESERLVSAAETAAKKAETEATVKFDAARSRWTRKNERLEADLSAAEARCASERAAFQTELAASEKKRVADLSDLEARLKQERAASQAGREEAERRRRADLAELEARLEKQRAAFETKLKDAEKRRVAELDDAEKRNAAELAGTETRRARELAEAESRRLADRETHAADLANAEARRVEELAEAETRRARDREALEARLEDAEARRLEELAEAESRRADDLAASAAKAARERDAMLAAWQQERSHAQAEAEAAAEVAAAELDTAKLELEAARAAAGVLELERDAARGAADESERVRAEAAAFAESWRAEADKARRAADAARKDAESAVLSGRAETAAELARLRAAHETRVADAASALEEERRLDAETTAHAVRAAEAGVSAALEEALSAVEDARQDARDAAAAFSVTLVFRAWWMRAKHCGAGAREDAVAALARPKTRARRRAALYAWFQLAKHTGRMRRGEAAVAGRRRRAMQRMTMLAWLAASPRIADVARAGSVFKNRLKRRGLVAWRRVSDAVKERAEHVERLAARECGKNLATRRLHTLREALRAWHAESHRARVTRVAFLRGAAAAAKRRARRAVRAWCALAARSARFARATREFVSRRRLGILRAATRAWFETACAEAHEARLASAASERFWRSKGKRVARGWASVARAMRVERRVTSAYVKRRRRFALRAAFTAWRDARSTELAETRRFEKAARRAERLRRASRKACFETWRLVSEETRVERVLLARRGVARARRAAGRLLTAWRVFVSKRVRERVALVRHATRQRRALLKRSVQAWTAMMETEAAGVVRLLEARARRQFRRRRGVAFSRWRLAAETTREKHRVALEHREAHVCKTVVLRPWLALRDAARERERREKLNYDASVAEAERRFALRVDKTRRKTLDAFRANRERGFRAERASRYFSLRRENLARSRVWANWAVLARDSRVALERHAAMRRRSRLRAATAAWRSAAARDKLERALESRRETALRGFKKVGAWRLVERVTLAWCHLADEAARGRHNVALMRKVRVATRVVREWAKRVDAAKTYRAAFVRVVNKGVAAQKARFFVAWRAGMRHAARDAARREAKALARGAHAPARHVLARWREATREARLEMVAARRAAQRALATTWRKLALGFVAWRCFAGDVGFRRAASVGAAHRAEAHARRLASRHAAFALRAWRLVACVQPRRAETCLGRGDVRRVSAAFAAWRVGAARAPRDKANAARRAAALDAFATRRAAASARTALRSWLALVNARDRAAAFAARKSLVRLIAATREWRVVARAVARTRDDAAARHRRASCRRADAARRRFAFDSWRARAASTVSCARRLDEAKARAADVSARRARRSFATGVVRAWRDAARAVAAGRETFARVARCASAAQTRAAAAERLRAWRAAARETRAEAARERRRAGIASTLATRRAWLCLRDSTQAWQNQARASSRVRRWIAAREKKHDARLRRRVMETWRRARVLSARREVPVVRAWQKRIDRASAARAAAESMRARRQRARLVHASFFTWRGVVVNARVHATRFRAAASASRRVAARAAFEAWRRRARRLRRAVAAGDFKKRARETARAHGCFCAWATLRYVRPRWSAHSAIARRRLNALGSCLERASGRAVRYRFDSWARRAAAGAARRAAEAAVAAEEAGRRARVAREARERNRAEAVAAAALSVAESVRARETMARVVRVDVAALGDGAAARLGDASDGETSAAFGPEPNADADANADATRAEDDAVLRVERRLAVDAADAAALKAAAVAARRAASEATSNELLARERLEAARAEIARLRAESSAVEPEFAALPESTAAALPAPTRTPPVPERESVDVAVGSSPPVSPREAAAQTAWVSTPLADVGVGVGPSLPRLERSTPPASPRESARFTSPPAHSESAANSVPAHSVPASPLESLAAANLEFAFSPEVESPGASASPRARSAELDARDARALAERLEAALTATAAAESRARVAEAAAVAAEAAAFDAVDMAMEYADEAHSPRTRRAFATPRSAQRRAGAETPPGARHAGASRAAASAGVSPKAVSPRAPRRSLSPGSPSLGARPPWGSSAKKKEPAAGAESPREARARRAATAALETQNAALASRLKTADEKLETALNDAFFASTALDESQRLAERLRAESELLVTRHEQNATRLETLETRSRDLATALAAAETRARDAETQVAAAEASGDVALAEASRCRAARDEARADAAAARLEAEAVRGRLENAETRCVDLAAQVNAWVERGFDVIRAGGGGGGGGSDAAAARAAASPPPKSPESPPESPGSPRSPSGGVVSPTVVGTPAWYAVRFEKPSLAGRSGAEAAAWAADAAAETPPMELLSQLKRAARDAARDAAEARARAAEAEAHADALVASGEQAERAARANADAAASALDAAEKIARDAETRADGAERRAAEASRAAAARQKAARAETASLVAALASAREAAARAAADAAETRAKAGTRVASKLADAEKRAATAEAAAAAAEAAASAAEHRARADVEAASARFAARAADAEARASRAAEDAAASGTRERESRSKFESMRDAASATRAALADAEARLAALANELDVARREREEARAAASAAESRLDDATRAAANAAGAARDAEHERDATKARLERAVEDGRAHEAAAAAARAEAARLEADLREAGEEARSEPPRAGASRDAATATPTRFVAPSFAGSFEEAAAGVSDVAGELADARAALREALRRGAAAGRPRSPSTPLESADDGGAASNASDESDGDDAGSFRGASDVGPDVLAALGSMAAPSASRRRGERDVERRRELDDLMRQRDAALADLASARRREATLSRANRDLKRAAMAIEHPANITFAEGATTAKTASTLERRFLRDREALERNAGASDADGLRVAEAALASALAELTK